MANTTRAEHLQWCKDRAMEYIKQGDWQQAWNSFLSDMGKHNETSGHIALGMGVMMIFGGHINNVEAMKKYIEDFN